MSNRRAYLGLAILAVLLVVVPLLTLRDSNAMICRLTGGSIHRGLTVEMGHASPPPPGSGITTVGPGVEGYTWFVPTASCR